MSEQRRGFTNNGLPVNTSDLYRTINIPKRFNEPTCFRGYGIQEEHGNPIYRTSNMEYGWYTPGVHTVPHRYFPKSNAFSTSLAVSGMYRNHSLNTAMDQTPY